MQTDVSRSRVAACNYLWRITESHWLCAWAARWQELEAIVFLLQTLGQFQATLDNVQAGAICFTSRSQILPQGFWRQNAHSLQWSQKFNRKFIGMLFYWLFDTLCCFKSEMFIYKPMAREFKITQTDRSKYEKIWNLTLPTITTIQRHKIFFYIFR